MGPYFCTTYPQWMTMKNKNGHIPLYLTIKKKDINSFFILCRYMTENDVDVKTYLRKKQFVEAMVEFGSDLLKNKNVTIIKWLLATFDYPEIFVWSANPHTFDLSEKSEDVSLINYVSKQDHKQFIDDILFGQCSINKNYA